MNRVAIPRWDAFDAYLVDIDGTLLHCTDAVHYFAFCEVLSSIARRPMTLDGVTAHGNTDVGILRDAWTLAGVADELWRPRLARVKAAMGEFVERRKEELRVTELPGVRGCLEHLRTKGALLGVATGNLEAIGRLKLEGCGLLDYFSFGGYSDDHEYRRDVFGGAVTMARHLAGCAATVCVIGDTPEDIRAARVNSLAVIAVATGVHRFDELLAERPDVCVHDLSELLRSG